MYLWLLVFLLLLLLLLLLSMLNPSALCDKLLGASFCISQVLSMFFPSCFNSCIVNVC